MNKKIPDDFICEIYKLLNHDLNMLNNKELIDHYLTFGINEKRIYKIPDNLPKNFNCKIYKLLNNDLLHLSDIELIKHYVTYGKYENRSYSRIIFQILSGGLGNQLFMLFNIISLSSEYNKQFYIDFDKEYVEKYLKEKNTIRKSAYNYNLYNKEIFKNINIDELNNFDKYNEKEYIYKQINLELNKNYILNGYFQSYKYFWKHKESIKKYIIIDENKINNIRNIYNNFNKKIIALHVRLGDYVNLQSYHPIQPINYYKKALSYYNLDNYQIILFSDNVTMARERLSSLNLNMINADNIFVEDEDQFYMLFLSNIIICSNSSFSLMSCYFNEIFEFNKDSEYILPNIWFGPDGPKYDMDDFVLNYKFYVIDINNIEYEKKFDVVSTIHIKDKNRYEKYLKYNKKYIQNVDNFYYISYKNFNLSESNYISEDIYPFSKQDIINYLKDYIPKDRFGWYYQQLLKLYIFKVRNFSYDYVLIFDSDILLLTRLYLFQNNTPLLFKRNTGDKKIHEPYLKTLQWILPNLDYDRSDSGICHLMLFNKKILNDLFNKIETIHQRPLWVVCLDSVINYVKQYSYNISILSEYELYYNYIKNMNKYIFIKDFEYIDNSYNNFDFVSNKNKYVFIADHHYQSCENNDNKLYID